MLTLDRLRSLDVALFQVSDAITRVIILVLVFILVVVTVVVVAVDVVVVVVVPLTVPCSYHYKKCMCVSL